ncbi:ubiquitin-conjugating enzyme E2 20-like, partial [Argentina anserina]|uniref:ubiquitin-conjugating enzyme E2 20-like n=1 Tax=Argentina anserina TaxID=57926 RepID=UPI0021767D19
LLSNTVNQDNILGATGTALANTPQASAKTTDSQLVLKRLQSELMALMMCRDSGISAFPERDNIFCWKGTINGSKDTVFEGTQFNLSLSFPNDYPFQPPKVKFETFCFHPNVEVVKGDWQVKKKKKKKKKIDKCR